ncbi:MAG TPA: tripartite tricarboxylate transporter permease [Methanoregulaceae archaeon]|nr:MAG: tripartite tricarboxylate transporter permease [Methanolinea sp.]HON81591.1 tripartite tricarboxylate transporter permease [Methanoregulaceae archaeon]HPD10398.1 tripartite tricarboxylate transporter permease [Methanoregulaceae archaeon]HRT15340.1 tripartite tricarboxylate transporter permease [Methanoregulaceae archaeon]HRU30990.1 tripartite tricarboxylate transporter permease [Methanoregulaceae archaeon]
MMGFLAGVAAGIVLGAISGLVPGIHVNTMAGGLLAVQTSLIPVFGPEMVAAAMVAALITHTFLDTIPSTFLGIPDPDTALSVIPSHALCLEGKGEEAVRIAALGSAGGFIAGILVALGLLLVAPYIQSTVDWGAGIVITAVAAFLVLWSESPVHAFTVFLASGLLGIFTFHFGFLCISPLGSSGMLMPLLSGLFGISILLVSGSGKVPEQRFSGLSLSRRTLIRGGFAGTAAGVVVGWLPGLSNATANAVIATGTPYDRDPREYIFATSAANTVNAVVGLAAFAAIARMRNGVMVALSSIEVPPLGTLILAAALAACCAYLITILLAGSAWRLGGIDKQGVNRAVIAFMVVLTFLLSGFFGLFVLLLATMTGLIPRLLNVPQLFCMGAVMVPVILFSFGVPVL